MDGTALAAVVGGAALAAVVGSARAQAASRGSSAARAHRRGLARCCTCAKSRLVSVIVRLSAGALLLPLAPAVPGSGDGAHDAAPPPPPPPPPLPPLLASGPMRLAAAIRVEQSARASLVAASTSRCFAARASRRTATRESLAFGMPRASA
eukprot:7385794-Prymnesium_polylepis.1